LLQPFVNRELENVKAEIKSKNRIRFAKGNAVEILHKAGPARSNCRRKAKSEEECAKID
jgi:hypothetical protein